MTTATLSLAVSVFLAAVVEMVEAFTIVLAMGMTRGWKSALAGVATALVALVAFTTVTGYALITWLPRSALQLVIGALLLIFGLQWLRKAILRAAGRKSIHDEDEIYGRQVEEAAAAPASTRWGVDSFGFVVSLKGVFLEGVEVVFIVLTFGLNAGNVPVAVGAAAAAFVVVLLLAVAVRAPLRRVPENLLKLAVSLLLVSYGTFWSAEGLGLFAPDRQSLAWPGGDLALVPVVLGWLVTTLIAIRVLRVRTPVAATGGAR